MITIAHFYKKELNLYGDTGNVLYIQFFLKKFGVSSKVINIGVGDTAPNKVDFIVMGGGPDSLQSKVYKDLLTKKDFFKKHIESRKPALFVCGSYQLMGKYYLASNGDKIPGLGVFSFYTKSPSNQNSRFVGNVSPKNNFDSGLDFSNNIVGFENHNGRTYLNNLNPLALANSKSSGNNAKDFSEGFLYKKSVGTYLHGPIFVKNPHLLFYLLSDVLKNTNYTKNLTSEYISHKNALRLSR
jgi:hypothetical protein